MSGEFAARGERMRCTFISILLALACTTSFAAPDLTNVNAIAMGLNHACALTTAGGVKCWGRNTAGPLGDGTNTDRPVPGDVPGLTSGVVAIAAGSEHTCALTATGGVKCWGANLFGQVGDGTTDDIHPYVIGTSSTNHYRASPVDVAGLSSGVVAITAGASHSCALTMGGGVKCWGNNIFGQLGDGTNTTRLAPVDVSGLATGVVQVSAGNGFTCALLSTGGVKCWGGNVSGQVGDGTTALRTTPVDVSGLAGATQVETGDQHACAIVAGGNVKCWGADFAGQLGDGGGAAKPVPVDVVGLGAIAASVSAGGSHTCVVTTMAGAKCWGSNNYGELGNGTASPASPVYTPGDVTGLASGVASIEAGISTSCAVLASGVAKCWGRGNYGQLGNNTIVTSQTTPTSVLDYLAQAVAFAPVPDHDVNDAVFTVSATASSSLPVALASTTTATCTVSGSTVTVLALGYCSLTATQGGDATYWRATPVVRAFTVFNPATVDTPRLAAISTRGPVGTGDNVLIAGYITQNGQKSVVTNARGRSMAAQGVIGTLANPFLALGSFNYNDEWEGSPNAATIAALGLAPPRTEEASLLTTLPSGAWTARVSGSDGGTGIGIAEAFEVDHHENPLVGISTRGQVLTGDSVLIGGFVIRGNAPLQVIVRGRGPSLAAQGVAGTLADPMLQLYSGMTVIASNDDWGTAANASDIAASGFAPADARESAVLITLAPGTYTAIVSGAGATTGVGIVEIYKVGGP